MEKLTFKDIVTPFEHKKADGCLALFFLFISFIALFLSVHLLTTQAPMSPASKVLRYLMEEDPTACKGQNTTQNRESKNEKIITLHYHDDVASDWWWNS